MKDNQEIWRPIETAPKDGTILLLWCPSGLDDRAGYEHSTFQMTFGSYGPSDYQSTQWLSIEAETEVHDYGGHTWISVYTNRLPCSPTHWMQLPAPPEPQP